MLHSQNYKVEIIDSDQYRMTVCKDLGFSKKDRHENIRRLGNIASSKIEKDVVIISAINPYEKIRKELKKNYKAKVVWINCDLNTLIKRDTKGLYRRSMLADEHPDKLYNLTGVNDVYEIPPDPDFAVNTGCETLEESSGKIFDFIMRALDRNIDQEEVTVRQTSASFSAMTLKESSFVKKL